LPTAGYADISQQLVSRNGAIVCQLGTRVRNSAGRQPRLSRPTRHPHVWYRDVEDDALDAEIKFPRKEIHLFVSI